MKVFVGIDLGSTTTKAVLLDEGGEVLGRGITNSRSDYHLAADIARDEAFIAARFTLLERALDRAEAANTDISAAEARAGDALSAPEARGASQNDGEGAGFRRRLVAHFRRQQYLAQLVRLRETCLEQAAAHALGRALVERLAPLFDEMDAEARRPGLSQHKSDFFRDRAASSYGRLAERFADRDVPFDTLMGAFDKGIIQVEGQRLDLSFTSHIRPALEASLSPAWRGTARAALYTTAVEEATATALDTGGAIGTGYGRALLPFPKDSIRSEILCHGLGAHAMFPHTRTVLDIGGQDTKAIQVDAAGIVTSFQMNDRCAAGCGRYLGYIADEMNLGVHELGPLAMESTRKVKISSTCTVFAGAELRDRLSMGQKREDILAGLHRSIILRAMALLARSGGVFDEFTFTGGVANNVAAVKALRQLIEENYGERVINISPGSIYTGALGAALFALRAAAAAATEAHTGAASHQEARA